MVSKRSVFAAISLVVIIMLIFSFLWPLLFQPLIPRQEPYDFVPDWGTGVVVEGGDDTFLDNITMDDVTLDLNWTLDPSLIVAIVSPGDPPRYWRTTAYDRYIGTDWEKSNTTTQLLPTVSPGSEIVYHITQNISVQGVAGSFPLLALWPDPLIITNSIQCPNLPFPDSYDIVTDAYGTAILNGRFSATGSTTLQYDVTYNPLNWSTQIRPFARSASFTPSELITDYQQQGLSYLSPSTTTDIQTRLNSILSGVPDNAFEEAFAILNYFKTTFTFDPFRPRPGPSEEHVEWFLSQGSGVGVDIATAYTMFLRQSGIAARPVFGAVLGEDQGTQRVLHLMHLHFWVEVYVPVVGGGGFWVQFDPTPLPSFITDGSPPPAPSMSKAPGPIPPDEDPNVVSSSYVLSVIVTPSVVDRSASVQITATLTQDGNPEPGKTLDFYDETEQVFLGSNVTTTIGEASISFQYSTAEIIGYHILRVSFNTLSEYGGVALHGAANLNLTVTPLEINRTMYVRFNGTLSDAVNGRGISSSETNSTGVNIFLGPTNVIQPLTDANGYYSVDYAIPMSQAPLGVTAVHAEFEILGIIDFTISNWENLNVTATSQLSVQASPNSIRLNSAAIISGRLRYENGTGIPGQIIQIFWNGTLIGSNITDSTGYYYYNYTPPAIGSVTIRAEFAGASLIYGSRGSNTARVHEEGTIVIFVDDDDGDDVTQRGNTVYFSGWVEDQNGTRQQGVPVIIFLDQNPVVWTTTNSTGGFADSYVLVSTLPVGSIEVSANITHATLRVVSSLDYFIINSTTQIQNLQFDITPVMRGESVIFTGLIVDDQASGLSSQNLDISLSYLSTTIPIGSVPTQSDGTFTIVYPIPMSVPASVSTVSFDVTYSGTLYYGASVNSEPLDVFSNATFLIEVPLGPFAWNESVSVNGTLMDNFGRMLPNRDAQVIVNGTNVVTGVTNQLGQVAFVLRFAPSGETDVFYALQLRHETIITLNSSVRIITVEALDIMQPLPLIPIPLEWIAAIIVVIIIIVVVILVCRYWKRRPRQPTAPSIDAAAMLTALRQLLAQKKYREAIIYAFRMYEALIQAKFGIFRDSSITVREFAYVTVAKGRLDSRTMEVFIRGVEEARYSDHPISYNSALSSLNAFASLYNSLTGGNLRFVTQDQQRPESAEPEPTETG